MNCVVLEAKTSKFGVNLKYTNEWTKHFSIVGPFFGVWSRQDNMAAFYLESPITNSRPMKLLIHLTHFKLKNNFQFSFVCLWITNYVINRLRDQIESTSSLEWVKLWLNCIFSTFSCFSLRIYFVRKKISSVKLWIVNFRNK